MRTAKLIMVDPNNAKTGAQNNKFYDMIDNGDGTFVVNYGRIGNSVFSTKTYNSYDWDKKYHEKIRKGYRDNTELFIVASRKKEIISIKDPLVQRLVNDLQSYARHSVNENYTISSSAVTQRQIEEAQRYMNEIVPLMTLNSDVKSINKLLLEIFRTIPRKMKNVNLFLLQVPEIKSDADLNSAKDILEREQSLLDVMSGMAKLEESEAEEDNQGKSILDAIGVDIVLADDEDIKNIKNMMGSDARSFVRAYGVTNRKTEKRFLEHLEKAEFKNRKLLFHGSRNENWWNIIDSGLMLRPTTNVARCGAYLGHGLYHANKAKKSMGYTSIQNSYWSRGTDVKAFLALYEVHVGRELIVSKSEPWISQLNYDLLQKRHADSIWAKASHGFLMNDEFVTFSDAQNTIKMLVEIGV